MLVGSIKGGALRTGHRFPWRTSLHGSAFLPSFTSRNITEQDDEGGGNRRYCKALSNMKNDKDIKIESLTD